METIIYPKLKPIFGILETLQFRLKIEVEFVKSFYEEKLPFSKRNIDIVKNVMITEQNEEYTIRAKTGWTRENNINTGWWTGYIETKNGTYIFLQQDFYKTEK